MLLSTRAGGYSIEIWDTPVELDAPFRDRIEDAGAHGPRSMTVLIGHETRGALCRLQLDGTGGAEWAAPVSVLLVPETGVLFAGVRDTTLAVDVLAGRRLWSSDGGMLLWTWLRAGSTVVMVGELELVAYDLTGRRLWTEYIEPPHNVGIEGDMLVVDADRLGSVVGYRGSFSAAGGRRSACATTRAHERSPGLCGARAPRVLSHSDYGCPKSPKISTAAISRARDRMMKTVRWRHPPPAAFGSAAVSVGAEPSARS